jgi:predicted dehydrogenase
MKKKLEKLSRRLFLKNTAAGSAVLLSGTAFPAIVPASVFGKTAPSNKINIGQIGFGRIATTHDLPETLKHDAVRVIAVSDVDSKRAQQGAAWIKKRYAEQKGQANYVDVRTYGDYREMLAEKELDAVIISTPDHWHAQPAMEAALAGKHIYLQKPTSLTIEEGRMMSDTVRKAGVAFQLGSQQRSRHPWPQFKQACELVRNGRIGELRNVEVGLPGDPSGGNAEKMPVPPNLNYDMWLGSTPEVYYTEDRVHSQTDINDRPGWLRCEQFGAGMITGWGVHHIDIAHWGMNAEETGPIEVEASATFPAPGSGLWNVHGDFDVVATYADGVTMHISGKNPNGVRFEGSEGWIFVSRGDVGVTASDPGAADDTSSPFQASDPKILTSDIGPDEIHLQDSAEQHANWVEAILKREQAISPAEVAHRSCSACLVAHIAMKLGRKVTWDPQNERFKGDDEANAMLSRPQRKPYGTKYVQD